jgi:hypothetical protein
MTQYDNTNRGALFVNDRKAKDTHPDRTGTLNVDGVEYFIDGWLKDGSKGKFLSLSVKRKDKQPEAERPANKTHGDRPGGPKNRFDSADEDIPF